MDHSAVGPKVVAVIGNENSKKRGNKDNKFLVKVTKKFAMIRRQ